MSAFPAPRRGATPPAATSANGTSLRAYLEARRGGQGAAPVYPVDEAVALVVPLCLALKELHDRRERVYLHPSCVVIGHDGIARVERSLALVPTYARDRACMAPELQASLAPGDARASVFALGAMLYEMITAYHVGPGMVRPKEINPSVPPGLELLLEKALVANPTHRPDDLAALASALYHLAPARSIHPPEADPRALDHAGGFEVDIRLSMLPPEEIAKVPAAGRLPPNPRPNLAPGANIDAYGAVVPAVQARVAPPTVAEHLVALKAHLESDPRPRYVVNKDRMDHGPFTAVELLQQIASHVFVADDGLRDELSGQSRPIQEWEEFAAFASQAALKREIVAENKEVQRQQRAEKTAAMGKSTIALLVAGVLAAGAGFWVFKTVGSRKDDVSVSDDPNALDLGGAGGIKGQKRATAGGPGHGGGGGGGGGGMSYEAAIASNNQEISIGGAKGGPDLTNEQLSGPMHNATFLNGCGAPNSMKVTVKVAIRMGHPVGVSVYTNPPSPGVASCVEHSVRGLAWPVNPKMDSFVTTY